MNHCCLFCSLLFWNLPDVSALSVSSVSAASSILIVTGASAPSHTLEIHVVQESHDLSLVLAGDITQKGYEKKRGKLLGAYLPQPPGLEASMAHERRPPMGPSSASRYHRRRSSGTRDERYRSDVHTEAVQAALAKHKERKMAVPMPSKRRSLVVQTSMDAYTPPDTSSGSEEEGGQGEGTPTSSQGSVSMEHWISRAIHQGSTTSSSSSSTQSGGSGAASRLADVLAQTHVGKSGPIGHLSLKRKTVFGVAENGNSLRRSCEFGSDLLWPPPLESDENHSAPPDVTTYTCELPPQVERPQVSTVPRTTPKYGNAELMETGDGVPVSSRVSAKIQQLVNTLKQPRRPPLREFFVDDFEELLEVQQPDPNQPRPEGAQMLTMRGEQLGVVTNWPPSLEAALQRWGTISPKAPCLTTMDTNGKPLYVLTYGKHDD
ncbi:hypothetical protein ACEWY4_018604 [Coilia grayii]|uniref:DMAP1-binding domain-containing protein n=1 Tax=Coilia grayii TaxID=363190 RepID=A0ABD1JEW2_9TELE